MPGTRRTLQKPFSRPGKNTRLPKINDSPPRTLTAQEPFHSLSIREMNVSGVLK